ncbi:hypothetical protein ES703_21665 [subsurface metagenome]
MFLIFILSTVEINLYSYKDTYLLGEDIWIWWEIVNTGKSIGYYQKSTEVSKLYSNDVKMWDINCRKVPHSMIKGIGIIKKGKKYKIPVLEIETEDTVRFKEKNLIGKFGTLHFEGRGFSRNYIKTGEYFFSIFYWSKENDSYFKVWSDTLHLFIIEPSGKEKDVWDLYQLSRCENSKFGDKLKSVEYAFEILRNYPKSNYVGSTLNNLNSLFHPYVEIEEGERERFNAITRELLDYVEGNIRNYSGRTLKSALWCITFGEFKIGNSADKVREFIEKNNIPLDDKMKEFFYGPNQPPNPSP